ncbi:MAG: hypothetical protein MI867_05585 [Pseudomonadales bacterium]|nr:hypothetical protein [Pseudomonadales bacterium]
MALEKSLRKDLSPKAVKKAVLSTATQTPLTVYTAAAAFLGTGFALMVEATPIALSVIGIGATVSAANWAWQYLVKGDKHANAFVKQYRHELEQRRNKALSDLSEELDDIGNQQALGQIQLFKDKYDTFVEILDKKLSPEELTYNRYLSIAEQVFLGGLDNIENAALAIKSVSAIDPDRLIYEIETSSQSDDVQECERLEELKKRLLLFETQQDKAEELLLENEKALTHLDHVSTKIASINTSQGRAQVDLEDAMTELRSLIDKADKYSN